MIVADPDVLSFSVKDHKMDFAGNKEIKRETYEYRKIKSYKVNYYLQY